MEQKQEQKQEQKVEHHEHSDSRSAQQWNKWLVGASVVQIVLLAVIAFQLSGVNGGGSAIQGAAVGLPSVAAPSAPAPSAPTIDMKALVDDDAVQGKESAPVTIVEFSDYECPFCARFYSDTELQIREQYVKTGKVKFVYRDFPLSFHQNAQKAAEAAECAGEQEKYWEMHDALFEKGVQGGVSSFKQYARDVGLKTADFDKCLDSGQMAGEIRKDMSDGQRVGVQGTPAFYVNGQEISGAQPFGAFQQIIDAALASQ